MADLLRPHVCSVTVAPLASPRATPLAALVAAFPGCRACPDLAAAVDGLPTDVPVLRHRLAAPGRRGAGADRGHR